MQLIDIDEFCARMSKAALGCGYQVVTPEAPGGFYHTDPRFVGLVFSSSHPLTFSGSTPN